jgi:hypothetical protein
MNGKLVGLSFMKIKYINQILESARVRFKNHTGGNRTYRKLLCDTNVLEYFRRFYPFSEIKGMKRFLSRSKLYPKKFISEISDQVKVSKELFLSNLEKANVGYGTDFKIKVCNKELCLLDKMLRIKLFPYFNVPRKPLVHDVISKMNLKASGGLPAPWFSKRSFIDEITSIACSVELETFDLYNALNEEQLFTAAFKRFQITSSKMKARLVYCLTYVINVCEAFYDVPLKQMFEHPDCPMIHGRTQLGISFLLCKNAKYHCTSFDVKEFDIRTPAEIIVISFEYLLLCLGLVPGTYRYKLLCDIRDLLLCMPCFHPALELNDRKRGIISGSGLTSSIGSFCMYIMHTLTMIKYCNMHKMNTFRMLILIYVSSDDSLIFTNFKINTDVYCKIFHDTFDLELELEDQSGPHNNRAVFLGSTWIDGKPFRQVKRMFARILYGNPNLPKFENDHLLFCSRCYDILGNVADFESIWKTFHVPMSDRVFRSFDLMDYNSRTKFNETQLLDKRGFWETRSRLEMLDHVWTTR